MNLKDDGYKLFLIAVVFAFLTGCTTSASGPAFNTFEYGTKNGNPNLFIYWKYSFGDKYHYFDTYVDSKKIGNLKCKGYLETSVTPGHHVVTLIQTDQPDSVLSIKLSTMKMSLPINVKHADAYIKLTTNMTQGATGAANAFSVAVGAMSGVSTSIDTEYRLIEVSPTFAMSEIRDLNLSN